MEAPDSNGQPLLTGDYSLPAEGKAFLDAISTGESPAYNVRFDGGKGATFDSYDDHPRISEKIKSGPYKGNTSDAAGKYQMLSKTWDRYRNMMGLEDFSPENQDLAAWQLARDSYGKLAGRDLLQDLQKGNYGEITKVLSSEWASLGRSPKKFQSELMARLGKSNPESSIFYDHPRSQMLRSATNE